MRAAAILGLGCSPKNLKPFQSDASVEWRIGLPDSSDEADVILLFGGDGTIHRHLGTLVTLGLPVLIVPAGSGNDFARGLDCGACAIHCCVADNSARALGMCGRSISGLSRHSRMRTGPHASDSARYFCSVAGVGLDGEVARRANGLPRWLRGHGGYVLQPRSDDLHLRATSDEDHDVGLKMVQNPRTGSLAAISRLCWLLSPTLRSTAAG